MEWSRAILAISLLAALVSPTFSTPSTFIYMPTDDLTDSLSTDFHAGTCPQLDAIVRSAVQGALQRDINIAAGLLRIFFHDCFPNGCDASILLTGGNTEQNMGPNQGSLQPNALKLIDDIRVQVHRACGPTVSCADITALATRDAVVVSGGETYAVPLGRLDSLAPATDVSILPGPGSNVNVLLQRFQQKGFDLTDIVALSGAHTVGRAHCGSFDGAFRENADFGRRLHANCTTPADKANKLQDLDVTTPTRFDNAYYSNLLNGKGVFTSDMELVRDGRSRGIVGGFAQNQGQFFNRFGNAMIKLSQLRASGGEVRQFSCSRTNRGSADEASV